MAEEKKAEEKKEFTPASRPAVGARPQRPKFKRFVRRRKVCRLCVDKVDTVDYKDVQLIKGFTIDSGKILSRRITGTCAKHQRQITKAVKRNRNLSILPFVAVK